MKRIKELRRLSKSHIGYMQLELIQVEKQSLSTPKKLVLLLWRRERVVLTSTGIKRRS